MDNRTEIREFLASRRARITPGQRGLPSHGSRRVPGLRRGEVAELAAVSIEYYTRLERGNLEGVSEDVLEGLSRALQLDDAERAHLFDLTRAAARSKRPRRYTAPKQRVRPGVQLALDAITGAPAFVGNRRLDILAANQLGYALYCDLYDKPARPANHARFIFFDERARSFYLNWELAADETVAILHTGAGRDPYDRALTDLVGELSTRSDEFRTRWATHNVRQHNSGSSTSATRLWESSICCSKLWNCRPTPDCRCTSTAPSPAPPPTTGFAYSRAGRRPTSRSTGQSPPIGPTGPESCRLAVVAVNEAGSNKEPLV